MHEFWISTDRGGWVGVVWKVATAVGRKSKKTCTEFVVVMTSTSTHNGPISSLLQAYIDNYVAYGSNIRSSPFYQI